MNIIKGGIIMDCVDKINDKYIKYRRFFQIALLILLVVEIALAMVKRGPSFVIEALEPYILQVIFWIIVVVVSGYLHEFGHYLAKKYYFPNVVNMKFVWTTFCYIPVPHMVQSEKLNGIITVRKAMVIFIAGPLLGFVPVIMSYNILEPSFFILLVIGELLTCKSDFEKMYLTFKEWRQGLYD